MLLRGREALARLRDRGVELECPFRPRGTEPKRRRLPGRALAGAARLRGQEDMAGDLAAAQGRLAAKTEQ